MDKTNTKANLTTRAVLALVALTLVTPLTLAMLLTVAPVSSAKWKAVAHRNTPLKNRKRREPSSSPET